MNNIKKEIKKILNKNSSQRTINNVKDGINGFSYQILIDDQKFFLKIFPLDYFNKHDRIKSELIFLSLLKENKFQNIPEIILYDKKDRWILYKWIEGKKIKDITKMEVENLVDFLIKIQTFKNKRNLSTIPNASEACFSLVDHQKLISSKLNITLNQIDKLTYIKEELKIKIKSNISEKIKLVDSMHKNYISYLNLWNYNLTNHEKCISPSDVGFHNIIKSQNNLIFFDFEYSGIDDPLKLIVDLIIQPDYCVPTSYIYIIKKFINIFFKKIPFFNIRLKAMVDLYQIKWFCIILNPIIKSKSKVEPENLINFLNKSNEYFLKIEKQKAQLLDQIKIN